MKKLSYLFAVAASAACLCACTDVTDALPAEQIPADARSTLGADVVLQWNNEEQTIDGFGVAQAGWSDYLYAHRKRQEIMDVMFGQDGLRLSILRGEVFPHYDETTFNMDEDINLSLDDPFFDIDFNRDENRVAEGIAQRNGQLWIMKKAKQEYGVDKLIFSVWSALAYMKSNGSTSQGFLKRGSYQAFADYLSNFCDAYTAAGLPVYAISPANEPEYAASWNSCLWLPGTTTLGPFIVNNLGPKLRQTHPETRIIFGENAQWSAILGFIMGSKNYVRDILNLNPKITNFPVIAAGHGYVDPVTGNMDAAVVRAVLACVRVVEQHGQAGVGGEDTHPLDLIHLGGEKGHELPQRVQILIHHLGDEQIVVHVGVVVHRHEIEGEVAGEPAVPAADHHVGHVEDPVGVHIVVDRGTVGTRRIGAVEVQNLLPVLRPGIGQPGLVAVGADRGGLGLVEIVLVAVTVSHVGIERGIEGVETADRRPLFGVIPHQHLQERAGHPLFLVKKVCGASAPPRRSCSR